jgi:hypothetical protein
MAVWQDTGWCMTKNFLRKEKSGYDTRFDTCPGNAEGGPVFKVKFVFCHYAMFDTIIGNL